MDRSKGAKDIHIGLNLLFLQPGRNRGTETYVRELLSTLTPRGGCQFTAFCSQASRPIIHGLDNVRLSLCPLSGRNRFLRVLYEQFLLCRRARKAGCDVLFCPGYLAPLHPTLPVVVTIHDTQFRDVPELILPLERLVYEFIVPRAARKAAAVLTMSEFSKQRILHHLSVRSENVFVAHQGARTDYRRESGLDSGKRPHHLPEKYLFSVSGGGRHKNIARLLDGYAHAVPHFKSPIALVLAGQRPEELTYLNPPRGANIQFLGYISDAELLSAYQKAHGFVLASLYEGFGLPILEAMDAGVPVAASNAASLPEVAGDAAILFNPYEINSIASAMIKLTNDESLREDLIRKGRRNLQRFSWNKCADITLGVLRQAAGGV